MSDNKNTVITPQEYIRRLISDIKKVMSTKEYIEYCLTRGVAVKKGVRV